MGKRGLSMRSYLIVIIGFTLMETINLSADENADKQTIQSMSYDNSTLSSTIETVIQQIDSAQNHLKKIAPRCYVTLTTLSCIMIPTIIFLIKIVKIKSDTKLVLRPSAVMQQPTS